MKSSHRLNEMLRRAWYKTLIPVAKWLNNWQFKVSMKTRNRWVLTIMGLLLIYGVFSLMILFF